MFEAFVASLATIIRRGECNIDANQNRDPRAGTAAGSASPELVLICLKEVGGGQATMPPLVLRRLFTEPRMRQMKAKDVMTTKVVTVSPDHSVRHAARIMLDHPHQRHACRR